MVFRQYTPTPTCLTIVRPDLPFRQLPGHLQRHDRQQMGGRYCAAGILAILSDMSTPEPELRWYQFTLRSLMLLTLFVAVICSLGVCTHWLVSAVIAMFALAGMAGRIVAGTRLGFVQGVVFGIQFDDDSLDRCQVRHFGREHLGVVIASRGNALRGGCWRVGNPC